MAMPKMLSSGQYVPTCHPSERQLEPFGPNESAGQLPNTNKPALWEEKRFQTWQKFETFLAVPSAVYSASEKFPVAPTTLGLPL
jgi:hypothetical protein